MENFENIDNILSEAKGFNEIPVNPKALTDEGIAELDRSRRERSDRIRKVVEPEAVEPAAVDPIRLEPVPVDPAERKALLKFIGRTVSGVAVGAGAIVAQTAGLMDVRLAIPVAAAALAFVTFWAGAWIEYKFGGLLDG